MIRVALFALLAPALIAPGCGGSAPAPRTLTLATTTSTQDSGLLDILVPLFRRRSGIEVKVVAVGSGQALQLGRRGDADLILAHSPGDEERFMAEGHGEARRAVMHNEFVLVGPPSDPAGVRGTTSVAEAFRAIAASRPRFVSRGDDSGTHRKEQEGWKAAGVEPGGDWYIKAGAGMAQVLRMADQVRGYTLADRATYLAEREATELVVVARGDPLLRNEYHALVVRPEKHPGVNAAGARAFAEFLRGDEARRVISAFGVDRFGESLFTPADPEHGR